MPATPGNHGNVRLYAVVGMFIGAAAVASWRFPSGPLLVIWLAAAMVFGGYIALSTGFSGMDDRARALVTLYSLLIPFGLLSTMVAARRSTSATHLRFVGVHLEHLDTVRVGIGSPNLDFVLAQSSPTELPWTVTLVRARNGWQLLPSADVDEVTVQRRQPRSILDRAPLRSLAPRHYEVANAALLVSSIDAVTITMPDGSADTLRLSTAAGQPTLHSTTYGTFRLTPVSSRLNARNRRELAIGTPLSTLDGARRTAPYERFVRVQKLPVRDYVNGESDPILSRLWHAVLPSWIASPQDRYLITASMPFTLTGAGVGRAVAVISDSARIAVRHMGTTWQFDALVRSRMLSAAEGLSLKFVRNPRPLDSPLPTGVSCSHDVACAALSLRRLPAPIAHIALDEAGLDATRYGLMAKLAVISGGFEVITPRGRDTVMQGATQPRAIASTFLASDSDPSPKRAAHYVLVTAAGTFGDGFLQMLLAGVGLAILLWSVFRVITTASTGLDSAVLPNERALALALNAVLGLLLTRLIIGARVKLFTPFESLGFSTAIGMWIALASVTVGLLQWSRWAPGLLAWTHGWVRGSRSIRGTIHHAWQGRFRWQRKPAPIATRASLLMIVGGIVLLFLSVPDAVWYGLVCGIAVLGCWFGLAWVAAFSAPQFDTFEQGPWTVVELVDENISSAPRRLPQQPVLLFTLIMAVTLWLPLPALGVATVGALVCYVMIRRRRRANAAPMTDDPLAVTLGIWASVIMLGMLRTASTNGAMAAFAFVILVALVSVRSGRAIRARFPTGSEAGRAMIPVFLVAPFAVLAFLAKIDMGLLLITAIPICIAALLAMGLDNYGRLLRVAAFIPVLVVSWVLVTKVLFPPVGRVATAASYPARAAAFDKMGSFFGLEHLPVLGGLVQEPMARVAARAIATRDQDLAERVLVAANPGPARELLQPSIEQIWGAGAYAAAGLWGVGMGRAPIGRHGIAEAVSYAENSYAVYVLAEHGVIGGVMVLLLYLMFLGGIGLAIIQLPVGETASMRATRALFLVAGLLVVVPALYVVLSNLRKVPITGQNMPFLGLNAWSDVTLCAGVIGILVSAALRINSVKV